MVRDAFVLEEGGQAVDHLCKEQAKEELKDLLSPLSNASSADTQHLSPSLSTKRALGLTIAALLLVGMWAGSAFSSREGSSKSVVQKARSAGSFDVVGFRETEEDEDARNSDMRNVVWNAMQDLIGELPGGSGRSPPRSTTTARPMASSEEDHVKEVKKEHHRHSSASKASAEKSGNDGEEEVKRQRRHHQHQTNRSHHAEDRNHSKRQMEDSKGKESGNRTALSSHTHNSTKQASNSTAKPETSEPKHERSPFASISEQSEPDLLLRMRMAMHQETAQKEKKSKAEEEKEDKKRREEIKKRQEEKEKEEQKRKREEAKRKAAEEKKRREEERENRTMRLKRMEEEREEYIKKQVKVLPQLSLGLANAAQELEDQMKESDRQDAMLQKLAKQSTMSTPSLYCFSLVMPYGYEPGLMAAQDRKGVGIFQCDDYTIFSNLTHFVDPHGQPKPFNFSHFALVNTDLQVKKGGKWFTSLNAGVFNRVWTEVVALGFYRHFDWSVKADPDTVFFPDRLRALLHHQEPMRGVQTYADEPQELNCHMCLKSGSAAQSCSAAVKELQRNGYSCREALDKVRRPPPMNCGCTCNDFACDVPDGTAMYLNNCKFGLHGPIEVFSRRATALFVAALPQCFHLLSNPWGEDKFIDRCFQEIGSVARVDSFDVLDEEACGEQPSPCGASQVSFHPFKSISSYFQCWDFANRFGHGPEGPWTLEFLRSHKQAKNTANLLKNLMKK